MMGFEAPRRISMPPGLSLRRIHGLVRFVGAGTVCSSVFAGVAYALFGKSLPGLVAASVLSVALFCLGTLVAIVFALRRRDVEAGLGYTTAPHAFMNLATVDDRTGLVLREAGEPLLTPAEYESRCQSLRAAAERATETK